MLLGRNRGIIVDQYIKSCLPETNNDKSVHKFESNYVT